MDVTIYYIGYDKVSALDGMPFDSVESAASYADDEGGNIYSATARVDTTTVTLVAEN